MDFYSSSEEELIPQPQTKKQKEEMKKKQKKQPVKVPPNLLKMHGFDEAQLVMFPRSYKPRTVPFQLLKKELLSDIKEQEKKVGKGKERKAPINPMMAELMKQKDEGEKDEENEEEITISVASLESQVMKRFQEWQRDQDATTLLVQTQAIYEHFTQQFQADSNFKLETYFKRGVLNFTNIELKMNMFKAICITIPYLPGCKQVIFNKNGLRDEFAGLFLFGVFMNPDISSIHVIQNLMSDNFVATLRYLLKQFP